MLTPIQMHGYMQMVYAGMESMDRDQRKMMFKAIKEARKEMDFHYPTGKPDLLVPTEEQSKEILNGPIIKS